jgi:Rhodopirellula transposase.
MGLPVISVDTKKKENIGNFKNNGSEYAPKGNPTAVLDHDFPILGLGKASPYGIYDVRENEGYVNVGISSDTAEFAARSIRIWWDEMGCLRYPGATKLYITADVGAATAAGTSSGRSPCNSCPMRQGWRSTSPTSLRGHPSGTRSSTACSAT